MRFATLEELIDAWRQAEAAPDDGKHYYLSWQDCVDPTLTSGQTGWGQWTYHQRRWEPLPLPRAMAALLQDLMRARRAISINQYDTELAQYELREINP